MTANSAQREKLEFEFRNYAGVSPRAAHCRFDNFDAKTKDQQRALAACRQYAHGFTIPFESPKHNLWILGPCGVGKTHLAVAIVHELVMAECCPTLTNPRAMGRRLLEAMPKGGYADDDELPEEFFAGCGLLLLDDVGAAACSDAEMGQVVDLIDARHRDQAPIVMTSNLSLSELREELGDRAFDRLREDAQLLVIEGESRRQFRDDEKRGSCVVTLRPEKQGPNARVHA